MLLFFLVMCIIFGIGFAKVSVDVKKKKLFFNYFINDKDNPNKLWVDTKGTTYKQSNYFTEKFGGFFRLNTAFVRLKNKDPNVNLFQKKYLYQLLALQVKNKYL